MLVPYVIYVELPQILPESRVFSWNRWYTVQKQEYGLHEGIAYASQWNKHEVSSTYTTQHRVRERVESYKIESSSVYGFKRNFFLSLVIVYPVGYQRIPLIARVSLLTIRHRCVHCLSMQCNVSLAFKFFEKDLYVLGVISDRVSWLFFLSSISKRVSSFTLTGCIATNRVFFSRIRWSAFSLACRMIFWRASKSCVSTPLCIVNASETSFYFCSYLSFLRPGRTYYSRFLGLPLSKPNSCTRVYATHTRRISVRRKISLHTFVYVRREIRYTQAHILQFFSAD